MRTKRESGAALAETVVLLTLLIPLALGVSMIGKMIDVKQTTVQASRYAAWESTVHDDLPADFDVRFFGDINNPIDGSAAAPNALWGEADDEGVSAGGGEDNGSGGTGTGAAGSTPVSTASGDTHLAPYWIDSEVVIDAASVNFSQTSAYEADAQGAKASEGPAKKIGEFVGHMGLIAHKTGGVWDKHSTADDSAFQTKSLRDGFDLDGLVRAEVSAGMQGNGWVDPMTFTQGTVILNDNWSASNAMQARDRVRTLVPAGGLRDIGNFIGAMGQVPGIKELKYFKHDGGRGVFGYVNMQPLPPSETQGVRPLKTYEGD